MAHVLTPCYSLVRSVPRERNLDATFKIVIKSGYLLKACKDVIRSWPGISWNSDPLEVRMLSTISLFYRSDFYTVF